MAAPDFFRKYDKIPLGTLGRGCTSAANDTFVVTEKVHGSNFSVHVSGQGVAFGKRSGLIEADDDFFSFRSQALDKPLSRWGSVLLRILADPIVRAQLLGGEWKETAISRIGVYGELFGGLFVHPEVGTLPGVKPVQKGVCYSNGLHFLAFDLLVYPAAKGAEESPNPQYIGYRQAAQACETAGFMFAKPLCTGSLATCLAFGHRFDSTIPRLLGLPHLSPNLAEGVVVRALKEPQQSRRAMFKIKIKEFSEVAYLNRDWKAAKSGGKNGYDSGVEVLRCEMLALLTENRLNNVISKHGRLEHTNKEGCKEVLEELKRDVMEDLCDVMAREVTFESLSTTLRNELDANARQLIISHLQQARADAAKQNETVMT